MSFTVRTRGDYILIRSSTTITYNDMEPECTSRNRYPVSFGSEEEFDEVIELWEDEFGERDFWTGLRCNISTGSTDSEDFYWLDGTDRTYDDFWKGSQPNNSPSPQICVSYDANAGGLQDKECFERDARGIICEQPMQTDPPSKSPTIHPTLTPTVFPTSTDDDDTGVDQDADDDGSDKQGGNDKDDNELSTLLTVVIIIGTLCGVCGLICCAGIGYYICRMNRELKETRAQFVEATSPRSVNSLNSVNSMGETEVDFGGSSAEGPAQTETVSTMHYGRQSQAEGEGENTTDPFAYGDEGAEVPGATDTSAFMMGPGTDDILFPSVMDATPGNDLLDTRVPGYEEDYMETGRDGEPIDSAEQKSEDYEDGPGFVPDIGSKSKITAGSIEEAEEKAVSEAIYAVKKQQMSEKDDMFGRMLRDVGAVEDLVGDEIVSEITVTPGNLKIQ